jgi:hypothetical protein
LKSSKNKYLEIYDYIDFDESINPTDGKSKQTLFSKRSMHMYVYIYIIGWGKPKRLRVTLENQGYISVFVIKAFGKYP